MNKLFLMAILFIFVSACSIGPKCTYTQEGTKIESWLWVFKNGKPVDVDEMNCN